jgi:hypothetical protein
MVSGKLVDPNDFSAHLVNCDQNVAAARTTILNQTHAPRVCRRPALSGAAHAYASHAALKYAPLYVVRLDPRRPPGDRLPHVPKLHWRVPGSGRGADDSRSAYLCS